jgi:hypothetical protein
MAKQPPCQHIWLLSGNITFDSKHKRPRCTMVCEKCGARRSANLGDEYTEESFQKYIKIDEQSKVKS